MVNFVKGCIDEGAPEINVNGVASIQRISNGQLMISYYKRRNGELIITARVIWDRDDWLTMWATWDRNRDEITRVYFENLIPGDRPAELH